MKMPEETFTERFNRLVSGVSETEVGVILGISESAVRKLKRGDTQTLKLDGALRLANKLGISPFYLAGMPDPSSDFITRRLNNLEPAVNHLGIRDKLRGPLPGDAPLQERLLQGAGEEQSDQVLSLVSQRLAQQNLAIARALRALVAVLALEDSTVNEALQALEGMTPTL